MKQPLHMAGGTRLGEFYVELPAEKSTRYHVRQYLRPPSGTIPGVK